MSSGAGGGIVRPITISNGFTQSKASFFGSAGVRPELLAMHGSYFVIQGLLVLIETEIHVEKWPPWKARAWTLAALGVPSPLFALAFKDVQF